MVFKSQPAAETGGAAPREAIAAESIRIKRWTVQSPRAADTSCSIALAFPADLRHTFASVRQWLKIEFGTGAKPETLAIARALESTPHTILGTLVCLWEWANVNSVDGYVEGATLADLDRIGELPGIGAQLVRCGWVKENSRADGDGPCGKQVGILFVNFDRHNGPTAKRRAMEARSKRQRRHA